MVVGTCLDFQFLFIRKKAMEWLFFIISYLDLWLISFYAVAIFNTFAAEENLLANQSQPNT